MVEVAERVEPLAGSGLPSVLDALVWPDETAAFLSVAAPGGAATALLDVLDPARLSHAGRLMRWWRCSGRRRGWRRGSVVGGVGG